MAVHKQEMDERCSRKKSLSLYDKNFKGDYMLLTYLSRSLSVSANFPLLASYPTFSFHTYHPSSFSSQTNCHYGGFKVKKTCNLFG
jgi:hypothetical protein